MGLNTNKWNRIRYTIYLPVYNLAGNLFKKYRRQSIESLDAHPDDKILIVGAGTGLDLDFLKGYKHISAIDITPGMIDKLKKRADSLGILVDARVMDGGRLEYDDTSFDHVILHLILAVMPDPYSCIKETERVLKPGGKAVILDKFLPDDKKPSFFRSFVNNITSFLFSNINRQAGTIISHSNLVKVNDNSVVLRGLFRIILLKKNGK